MASAAQTLTTTILINAAIGGGFEQVGATLTELGSMVNGLSQELINFGKDSANVYRNYEMSMKDAEVALSTTYGRGTKELKTVMSDLDEAATVWAATTIFHTNDVANAISEAAHAGWDFNQIMTGIPAAMQLAQAGGLDLSEAVNYIVKSSNAAGIGFEDMTHFIDLWAFAANSSASTIGEFGDAMLRMGSTMRFAGNTEELMTLIAVTANAGAVGSEAGTLIRNSMMRLIAPTEKAQKAMAQLGATSTETAAIMGDEALAAANAELAAHGFSAFYQDGPQQGQMKNVLDIYRELYVALGDIAGGYDAIDRNQDAISVLSAIFPTRTITEALTLLRGAKEGYLRLYEAMMGGEAEGYGQYAAETMMDTLNGAMETFESKVERLKQLVGEELSGDIKNATGFAGEMVDRLAEMDETKFSALVNGLEVVAGAGPGLLLAGGAFRFLARAMTPAGGIGLGLIALTAAASAIKTIEEADFKSNFGDMDLDAEGIQTYIHSLGEDFKSAYTEVNEFQAALQASVETYQSASSTFSSQLFSDMLTNAKLTQDDKDQLISLGEDMFLAVQGAIANSAAVSMNYWHALFGGDAEAEFDPAYQEIIALTNTAYEEAMAQASEIGTGLRKALTDAFSDGQISPEEYANIQSYMQSYNDAIAQAAAEAQSEEEYIQFGKWLHRAQTASLDDIQSLAKEAAGERDQILSDQEDRYLTERYRLQYRGQQQGKSDTEMEALLAEADSRHTEEQMRTEAAYDNFLFNLWDSQIQQSGMAENYAWLNELTSQYLNGGLTADTAMDLIEGKLGPNMYAGSTAWGSNRSDAAQLGKIMGFMLGSMGGEEEVGKRIAWYEENGNAEMAGMLRQMYAAEQLINGFSNITRTEKAPWDFFNLGDSFQTDAQDEYTPLYPNREAAEAVFGAATPDFNLSTARSTIAYLGDGAKTISGLMDLIGQQVQSGELSGWEIGGFQLSKNAQSELSRMRDEMAEMFDLEAVAADMGADFASNGAREYYAMWDLLYGEASTHAQDYQITVPVIPEMDEGGMPEPDPVKVKGEVELDTSTADAEMEPVTVQATVEVDAEAAQAQAEALNMEAPATQSDVEYNDPGFDPPSGLITEVAVVYNDPGFTPSGGGTVTVDVVYNEVNKPKGYATGGRATEASIFGEAGPEWAIPEEHSERTAELLNAAREASGFTWPDILERFGGLNANPQNKPATIIYSPTINAQDATGVEQVLREDKARLEKWFEEKQMMEDVEVYK